MSDNKKCAKCKEIKPVAEFQKEARAKNGFKPRCKDCTNSYYREIYPSLRDAHLNRAKKRHCENGDAARARQREYYKKNRDRILLNSKMNSKDAEKRRAYMRDYMKNRRESDPEFRVYQLLKSFLFRAVKGSGKKATVVLGYDFEKLKMHLGGVYKDESIDHKIPVSWFVSSVPPSVVHSLENIHVIKKSENSKKSNTFCTPVAISYFNIAINFIKPERQESLKIQP